MRRLWMVGWLVVVLPGAAVLAQGTERRASVVTNYRLVLVNGASYDVRGPIERRNGTIVFRDRQGMLGSILESQVREVQPLDGDSPEAPPPASPPAPAPEAPPKPPATGDAAVRYTNSDLAPLPEPAPSPGSPEPVEPPDAAAPEAPTEPPDEPPSILAPPPTEVAGRPESWWREQIGGLRRTLRELEVEEGETYRLWVCAMHDIPIGGGECRPQVNQLPPVNRFPKTPTQRSLDKELRRLRVELDLRRNELKAFIDQAIASGVPTAWILAGPDEPSEATVSEDAAEGEAPGEPDVEPEAE